MTRLALHLYDLFLRRPLLRWGVLGVLTLLMLLAVTRVTFREDISDFLPLDGKYGMALDTYQQMAGADRICMVFGAAGEAKPCADSIVASVDCFVQRLEQADSAHTAGQVIYQADWSQIEDLTQWVYAHLPSLLREEDYARIDSLLSDPAYLPARLEEDKQALMLPSGGLLADAVSRDPLGLFTPVAERLQQQGGQLMYETYDGYLFSPDMSCAIVMLQTPYGSSETERNEKLVDLLQQCAGEAMDAHPSVDIRMLGNAVVAVGNARQIKTDSFLAVALAAIGILALLYYVFRSLRHLLLIALTVGWGWLFALAMLSLVHQQVSIIVVGISSVILGIAVNYPLHVTAHLGDRPDRRQALKEIISPLVTGNITTVGAFAALIPLPSPALRDLGLFASSLLLGTIIFAIVFLPHMVRTRPAARATFIDRMARVEIRSRRPVLWAMAAVTIILGFFSLDTRFDADLSHINYMTDEQRADMDYFQRNMISDGGLTPVYVLSSGPSLDAALEQCERLQPAISEAKEEGLAAASQECGAWLCSAARQERLHSRWQQLARRYDESLAGRLREEGRKAGFAEGSFDAFAELMHQRDDRPDWQSDGPLARLRPGMVARDSLTGHWRVGDVVYATEDNAAELERRLTRDGSFAFTLASINSAITSSLSDHFNYIGWVCGLIVFFFLWLSLGSIEMALISFAPMALSWIWILGIMSLCGIQFNIVNIILATFIFGQGDDYTIFMTEGASYEYTFRRKILPSYKSSIILSALIMFIGIGTLITARHPALHSLAEVTIVGMLSVVFMAYTLPPLLFRFLVMSGGRQRRRPLTLANVLSRCLPSALRGGEDLRGLVLDRYRYKSAGISRTARKNLRNAGDALPTDGPLVIHDKGYGERALLAALRHGGQQVVAVASDEERAGVLRYSAEGLAGNLEIRIENSAGNAQDHDDPNS